MAPRRKGTTLHSAGEHQNRKPCSGRSDMCSISARKRYEIVRWDVDPPYLGWPCDTIEHLDSGPSRTLSSSSRSTVPRPPQVLVEFADMKEEDDLLSESINTWQRDSILKASSQIGRMILLHLSLCIACLVGSQVLRIEPNQLRPSPDTLQTSSPHPSATDIGNFPPWTIPIKDCPPLHTARLGRILQLTQQTINNGISDLHVRVIRHDNEERRKAAFKSYQYIPFLLERLFDISQLKPLNGLKPDRDILQGPHLACASPDSARKYAWLNLGFDPWRTCQTAPFPRAFVAPYTAYIFICPQFFDLSPRGVTDRCPDVVNNRFVGNEDEFFGDTQLYQMVMQFYELYLQGNAVKGPPREWNELVLEMGARESVLRVRNVAMWMFCEFGVPSRRDVDDGERHSDG
ncbi:MAG: hypothetical protein Q9174_005182 [Haloplaca sp. 1 TL-2023]